MDTLHLGLGLSELNHIAAQSYPSYSEFYKHYQVYKNRGQNLKDAKEDLNQVVETMTRIIHDGDTFLTLDETCAMLSVSPHIITKRWRAGRIAGIRWKKNLYLLRESVNEFVVGVGG